jgi:hypothetical protein
MKLTLKQPIVITENGETKIYEYAFLNLASSTGFNNPDQYTLALRLTPYRILPDGKLDKLENQVTSHSYLDALNSPVKDAATAILNVIQQTINTGV